jgi:hypothetical protein
MGNRQRTVCIPALLAFLAAMLLSAGQAQGVLPPGAKQIVVPNRLANVEGDRALSGVTPLHSLELFSPSQFSALSGGDYHLTRIEIRPDGQWTGSESMSSAQHLLVQMGVTRVSPANMTTTFADSYTGPLTTVYDAPWQTLIENRPHPAGPNYFNDWVVLTTPFRYSPADGTLLIDLQFDGMNSPTWIDGTNIVGDTSAIYAWSNEYTWPTGQGPIGGPVYRMTFIPVPEPGVLGLMAAGPLLVLRPGRRE